MGKCVNDKKEDIKLKFNEFIATDIDNYTICFYTTFNMRSTMVEFVSHCVRSKANNTIISDEIITNYINNRVSAKMRFK